MIHIIIDGDNIPVDKYLEHILPKLQLKGKPYYTTVIVQGDLKFKYSSYTKITLNIEFCKTKNKNATDSRLLFEAGKSIERGDEIIIVSNDKIFDELEEEEGIQVVGYNKSVVKQGYKLKKKNVMLCLQQAIDAKQPHEDIYLMDFQFTYFTHVTKHNLREFIESIPEISISQNECLYFTHEAR